MTNPNTINNSNISNYKSNNNNRTGSQSSEIFNNNNNIPSATGNLQNFYAQMMSRGSNRESNTTNVTTINNNNNINYTGGNEIDNPDQYPIKQEAQDSHTHHQQQQLESSQCFPFQSFSQVNEIFNGPSSSEQQESFADNSPRSQFRAANNGFFQSNSNNIRNSNTPNSNNLLTGNLLERSFNPPVNGQQGKKLNNSSASPVSNSSTTTLLQLQTNSSATSMEEYDRVRKLNHKEVERRRRIFLNEGFEQLKNLIPRSFLSQATSSGNNSGISSSSTVSAATAAAAATNSSLLSCTKKDAASFDHSANSSSAPYPSNAPSLSKGMILSRTVEYIQSLQSNVQTLHSQLDQEREAFASENNALKECIQKLIDENQKLLDMVNRDRSNSNIAANTSNIHHGHQP